MTTLNYPQWPPLSPFPETQKDTVDDGAPDFPSSPGDREKGKFRPSATPKLDTIAVVNDDGTQIGTALVPSNEEVAFWLRALYAGLVLKGMAEDVTEGLLFEGL